MKKKTIELYNSEINLLIKVIDWFTKDALSYNTDEGVYEDDLGSIVINKIDYSQLSDIQACLSESDEKYKGWNVFTEQSPIVSDNDIILKRIDISDSCVYKNMLIRISSEDYKQSLLRGCKEDEIQNKYIYYWKYID